MATYYGLRCIDCNDHSETWVRRYPEELIEYVKAYSLHKTIKEAAEQLPWYITAIVVAQEGGTEPFDWMDDHDGHRLIVYDEYGNDCPEVSLNSSSDNDA